MGTKLTAVEWLVNEILMPEYGNIPEWVIDKVNEAKAMEKEQMNKCYHPLTERKHTSDIHFECTICGYNNY